MARRLLDAGHDVVVWNRTPEKAVDLVRAGALMAETPAEATGRAEAVITMLADPDALAAVSEGPDGIASAVDDQTTVMEMSTVGPDAIARLASALPRRTPLLDAPVLGSVSEAESGSLKIFVGGPGELVERWTPLLSTLGSVLRVGPLGSGAAAKLVANATLFGVLGALGEALSLADGLGLSREVTFEVLGVTPLAAQAERRRPSVDSGDYPRRYALSLARKDAGLMLDAAAKAGIELRLIEAMKRWLDAARQRGLGDSDYSAVLSEIVRRPDGTEG
jgi:3-hydroxyisobutyrate dehydrogenase/2-hydroxy-3-oxopropionate reductase